MGGDCGVSVTVPASVRALLKHTDLQLDLVGDKNLIGPFLQDVPQSLVSRLSLIHSAQRIPTGRRPQSVLRAPRDSSLYLAVDLVRQGKVGAMVSAGDTGALLLVGRYLLKTLSGINKPAILAALPSVSEPCYLLDVGANLECDSQQLFEFAVMGTVLAESLGRSVPRVGLLNIGSEDYKGSSAVLQTAAVLEQCADLNYIGFIEANELFEGAAEVVVCDGFVGNVTIKSSAGVANVVSKLLDRATSTAEQHPLICSLSAQLNPQRFNGASLLGLQGSVVKSHGNATAEGFFYAIEQAIREIDHGIPQLIGKRVADIMSSNQGLLTGGKD